MDNQAPLEDESEGEPLPDETQPNPLLNWVKEGVGPALNALNDISLAQLSLSTIQIIGKEHRTPFALRLRYTLLLFIQAHDVLVIAADPIFLLPALALNMERVTKIPHNTPALLPSPDGCCSRQGKYSEFTGDDLCWPTAVPTGCRHSSDSHEAGNKARA